MDVTFYIYKILYLLISQKHAKISTADGTFHAEMFHMTYFYKNCFNVVPSLDEPRQMLYLDGKIRLQIKGQYEVISHFLFTGKHNSCESYV
jgi:hypothetical protein